MATANYGFPEINPSAKFDGANDINKLADAIDNSMKQVELLGKSGKYVLKPATALTLGGVIIGENINVASDGTISTDIDPYELPPASPTQLGGVIVPNGSGFRLTPDGTLSIDDSSVELPPNSVSTDMIKDGAVTGAKIAQHTVAYENLSASLRNYIDKSKNYIDGKYSKANISLIMGDTNQVKVSTWGPSLMIELNGLPITGDNSKTRFDLFRITEPVISSVIDTGNVLNIKQESSIVAAAWLSFSNGTFTINTQTALAAGIYTLTGVFTVLFSV